MDAAAKKRRGRKIKTEDDAVVADYHVANVEAAVYATPDAITVSSNHAHASSSQQHVILRIKQNAAVGEEPRGIFGYSTQSNFVSEPLDLSCVGHTRIARNVKHINAVLPNVVHEDRLSADANSSVCFWCCHPLDGDLFGLPIRFKDDKYHVCGCFCGFECATAFNFNSKELHQDQWNSFDLLNKMARESGYKSVVQPAPSRFVLKMFGGTMDIDDFRCHEKLVNPLPAPMMSIVQYMEEIMSSDIMHGSLPSQQTQPMFVPLDSDRVQRAKQNLLASSKPKKNTIHVKMGLRYGAACPAATVG